MSPPSATLLRGGVLAASSPLVGVLPPVVACTGSSSTVSAVVTTVGYTSVCSWAVCLAVFSTATASLVLWPAMLSGTTSDAALATGDIMPTSKFAKKQTSRRKCRKTSCRTYRSERLCVAAKNPPSPTSRRGCLCPPPSRVGSVCGAGGSLVTRPASIGATSGRLRGLRTKDGAALSSSSSSSSILTSQRRFGAWLVSASNASMGDGPMAIGLFPATLSSVVGAGWL